MKEVHPLSLASSGNVHLMFTFTGSLSCFQAGAFEVVVMVGFSRARIAPYVSPAHRPSCTLSNNWFACTSRKSGRSGKGSLRVGEYGSCLEFGGGG